MNADRGDPAAPIGGVLLAAGGGRRYGGPKALASRDGRLLVELALQTLRDGGCDPVVVVIGAAAAEVRRRADLGAAIVVDNPGWPEGVGSSLRAGLRAHADTPAEAVVVLLVDTPGITPAAVRRISRYAAADALAVASYQGQPGHPVLLGRAHWAAAAARAVGDAGARRYLRAHDDRVVKVECGDIADGTDIDEPGDENRAGAESPSHRRRPGPVPPP